MPSDDFFANEVSKTITEIQAGTGRIEFQATDGTVSVLKDEIYLEAGDVVDSTFMRASKLVLFGTRSCRCKRRIFYFLCMLKQP